MSVARWLVLGGLVIVALVALGAVIRPRTDGTAIPSSGASPAAAATAAATATATAVASPSTTPRPSQTSTPAAPAGTKPPRTSGDPRLAYAEFLLRVNDDRSTVDRLDRALTTATDARDLTAVRTAAVHILDFVDVERDWLRDHPAADCYAAAHASANDMLEAYGTAADRFVDWSAAGGGLAGLAAFGRAADAAGAAADALTAFGKALEGTTCRV